MKFPTRTGGALGGAFRANQFDQSPTPDFSNTKRGTSTIHKRNGFLAITDDAATRLKMPYLYASSSWSAGGFWHDYIVQRESASPGDITLSANISQQTSSPGGFCRNYSVYVGDGYVLEMCLPKQSGQSGSNPDVATALVPRLRDIRDLSGDFSSQTGPQAASFYLEQTGGDMVIAYDAYLDKLAFPSACALGWKDSSERYVFCIFGIEYTGSGRGSTHNAYAAKYFVYIGSTATRSLRRVELPQMGDDPIPLIVPGAESDPIHTKSWWGFEHAGIQSNMDEGAFPATAPGPVRCYAVGRGQAIALVTPQERIEIGRDEFGAPSGYSVHPRRLPPGKSQQLLRTRDFGESWTLENADFLIADMPQISIKNPYRVPVDNPLYEKSYDYPVQPCSFHSGFIAAPMGGGRIAIVAHGKPLHPPSASQTAWWGADHVYMQHRRAFRFYVSNEYGINFINKPWPLDHIDADNFLDRNNPSMGEVVSEYVLFNECRPALGDYSMGPGNFTIATVRYRRFLQPHPAIVKDYGKYPDDYHITVWSTNDYGDTWIGKPLPKECFPGVDYWRRLHGDDISESAAVLLQGEFDLITLKPSQPGTAENQDRTAPELAFVRDDASIERVQDQDGSTRTVPRAGDVCITSGDISTMERSVQMPYISMFSSRVPHYIYEDIGYQAFLFSYLPRAGGIYTGDASSAEYPEVVCRAHFKEFEGMTDG